MNNLNLPPFYVGQKVVYITGHNMPKNSIHTVNFISKKPCGCSWVIRIDDEKFIPTPGNTNKIVCVQCGVVYSRQKDTGEVWDANAFRAIQEAKPPLMTFTQIKEKEKEEILILN